jgi:type I restriction enzyme S subunit
MSAYFQSDLCADMINRFKNGAAQPNLSAKSLTKFIIPVPPIPEQQRIVGILDKTFDGIATAKVNAEKNLQNARALFESHLQSVFTQRGEGWVDRRLGDIIQKTETINPLQSPEAEFDYIDVSSISNATFQIEETHRMRGKGAPSRARRLVKAKDVLFATVRPTLRRIAIVPDKLDNQICSTGYFVFRPKAEVNHRFVFYLLFTEDFMGQMERLQKGASYPAVTEGEVRAQLVPIPPLLDQRRIVATLDQLTEDVRRLESIYQRILTALEELKKSLLHQAFRGQL